MEKAAEIVIKADPMAVLSFCLYLLIIVIIGILSTKFSSSGLPEFFLAGRKLKQFVVALSAVVSGRSAWLLVGVTGMAFTIGAPAVWAVTGYITAEVFLFIFVGKRLRRYTSMMDNLTLPDFFESRFKDKSNILRILSVFIILIFMISYVASQFQAGGKAFSTSFGVSETRGILVTAIIVLIYTVLGGFLAVSLTDMIQAFFMIFALLILPVIAIIHAGGWEEILVILHNFNPKFLNPFAFSVGGIIGFLGIGLGSPGNPHILVRYMSVADPKALRKSCVIGTVWNTLMAWGAVFIGLVGRSYYLKPEALPGGDPENLFPYLASAHLPPFLVGVITASILAAIMSTADSQLLVASSGIARDIYQKIIANDKTVPEKKLVSISRIAVLSLVIAALVFGVLAKKFVFWLVLFAWGGLGASFGPTLLLSLFWKRTTKAGVIVGLVSGTAVTIVWNQVAFLKGFIYELVPAFFVSFLLTFFVSLLTSAPIEAEAELKSIAAKYR
ncbi:MAG: sodium/proline symporter [Candidatus Aminicenantes bacterium]|nr:sodium/proline symporter [Candidatus Aminicenantes bacterium]MDH5386431.1 sodium/proline symporter [Candidatus Aminicenantes bacterium]